MSFCINNDKMIFYKLNERPYYINNYGAFLANLFANLEEQNPNIYTIIMDILPLYLPFLNPIEESFSKIKDQVRRLQPTSSEQLMAVIEFSYASFTNSDRMGYHNYAKSYINACLDKEE
ncbi:hypothetical protein RF11_08629 [Thelohanellus kitauei]|uniref:Tc1-like transposase DDE domain-containing protein n=1 Tax=Thelohanellus kitauei TaxID=669202 RepID=A0A0C2NB38_THEKT|nr:hypothetical protein RF11_08629 [Thelohanellus kitauei]